MSPKYIFIAAAGHSGSTLLDLLLGSHSKIESLGEISYLPKNWALNEVCGCGNAIRSCAVWKKVVTRLGADLALDIERHPYTLDLGYIDPRNVIDHQHQTKLYAFERELMHALRYLQLRFGLGFLKPLVGKVERGIENNFRLYDHVLSVTGSRLVVDSSKTYLKAAGLYRIRPKQVRVIQLVRDGRGVYFSGLRRGCSRRDSLNAWKKHYARALPIYKQVIAPEHILSVRYEDVVSNTRSTLMKIAEFAEVPFEESMLKLNAKVHHLVNGNQMKFGSAQIKSDRHWETQLTGADLRFFLRHAGPLNRRFGYM